MFDYALKQVKYDPTCEGYQNVCSIEKDLEKSMIDVYKVMYYGRYIWLSFHFMDPDIKFFSYNGLVASNQYIDYSF